MTLRSGSVRFPVRAARNDDVSRLAEIETRAGAAFRELGMDAVADGDPYSAEELEPFLPDDRAWVVTDEDDQPVAYLLVDEVDGAAHIEQVSVDPAFAGQRLGARLIDTARSWARGRELARLTLTTFRDVPWNGPYYERCGFAVLAEDDWTPGLVAIRQRETKHGLDAWPRVCMESRLMASVESEA